MSRRDDGYSALTVDVVLFAASKDHLEVLLVQRDSPPFEREWAFPGGFVEAGETLHEAARRELDEETSIREVHLEQLQAFGDPGRDPRGHVVTVAFWGLGPANVFHPPEADSDAARAQWWSVDQLPPLAFDHRDILTCALRRLRQRLSWVLGDTDIFPGNLTIDELRATGNMINKALSGETRNQ